MGTYMVKGLGSKLLKGGLIGNIIGCLRRMLRV